MLATAEETAISMLTAVINLYGAQAYPEILRAFRRALEQPDDQAVASMLCDALLDVVRSRTSPVSAGS